MGTSANLSDEEFKRFLIQCNDRHQGVANNARASCHQALAHGDYLAMFDNYHLIRKNASFDLDNKILPNPPGERRYSEAVEKPCLKLS